MKGWRPSSKRSKKVALEGNSTDELFSLLKEGEAMGKSRGKNLLINIAKCVLITPFF